MDQEPAQEYREVKIPGSADSFNHFTGLAETTSSKETPDPKRKLRWDKERRRKLRWAFSLEVPENKSREASSLYLPPSHQKRDGLKPGIDGARL